eukprot:gene4309-biopygen8712
MARSGICFNATDDITAANTCLQVNTSWGYAAVTRGKRNYLVDSHLDRSAPRASISIEVIEAVGSRTRETRRPPTPARAPGSGAGGPRALQGGQAHRAAVLGLCKRGHRAEDRGEAAAEDHQAAAGKGLRP